MDSIGFVSDGPISGTLIEEWLSQFDEPDRITARFLLDSILYVSNDKFIGGLRELIISFLKAHAAGPIALFAARENLGEAYWRSNSRPQSVAGRMPVGSEGIISHLCRDIAKSIPDVLNHPSIPEMRSARCRHILCVDDMIGSGSRMIKFAEWLYQNKTVRSWHSMHYISFVACAYAASAIGRGYVAKNRLISNVQLVQSIGEGRAIWTRKQREYVEDLCGRYAEYTRKPNWPIGFEKAFTMIIFPHNCPNTTPAILWASKTGSWRGIFSGRPEFYMSGARGDQQRHRQERILNALGHTRLTKPSLFSKLSDGSRQLLVLLSCLAAHRHFDNILSDILELSLPIIRKQIAQCQLYRWIDTERRLTQLGKNVLISARRNECMHPKDIELKDDFYYPKQLRSPESSTSSGLH